MSPYTAQTLDKHSAEEEEEGFYKFLPANTAGDRDKHNMIRRKTSLQWFRSRFCVIFFFTGLRIAFYCASINRLAHADGRMWGRIGGVAGNIRTNVSQLAKDVLEGDEDSPRQVCT